MPRKQSGKAKGGSIDDAPQGGRFSYPKLDKPPISVKRTSLPDGSVVIAVNSLFASISCSYHPEELKEWLTDHVKSLLYVALTPIVRADPEELQARLMKKSDEAYDIPIQELDPELRELVVAFGNFSYETFISMIIPKMYELPELLVEQIHYKIISELEKEGRISFGVKAGARKIWDDLVNEMGKDIKDEWLSLKPGPKEVTSDAERAEMLDFYTAQLAACQSAKLIYKQNRNSRWRAKVKERHPELDKVVLDNLPDHKPSELAALGTGKRFRKIIGRDFRGIEEVKRQLRIARKETKDTSHHNS